MFYVYEHWRPDTNRPFYVGKGRGWRAHALRGRNKKHKNIVAKAGRVVKFVATGLNEKEAFDLERERITLWRSMGLPLANFTDGGEGSSGSVQSATSVAKRSKALTGRKRSEVERANISAGLKGRIFTLKWRAKMSEAAKSRPRKHTSEITKAKIGAANKGRHSGKPWTAARREAHQRKQDVRTQCYAS